MPGLSVHRPSLSSSSKDVICTEVTVEAVEVMSSSHGGVEKEKTTQEPLRKDVLTS
jgi:hypothetical protein